MWINEIKMWGEVIFLFLFILFIIYGSINFCYNKYKQKKLKEYLKIQTGEEFEIK